MQAELPLFKPSFAAVCCRAGPGLQLLQATATELICNVVPGLSMTWLDSEPKFNESNVSSCAPVFWDGLRISILARSAGTAGHPTWPPHCPTAAAAWAPGAETGAGAHAKVATVERRRVEARACGRGRSAPGHQS